MQPPSIELALIAGRAVFLLFSFIVAAIAFTRWRRAAERDSERINAQHALLLEHLAGLESRINAMHLRVDELIERMDSPRQPAEAISPSSPSYALAIRLARSGASNEEIISTCGITQQEADLVRRLHAAG